MTDVGDPARSFLQVGRAHDVVAVEHGARPVAGHLHGDALRDAGVDHVAHGTAATVVPEHAGHAGRLAGRGPGVAEISATPSPPLALTEVREEVRHDPAQ